MWIAYALHKLQHQTYPHTIRMYHATVLCSVAVYIGSRARGSPFTWGRLASLRAQARLRATYKGQAAWRAVWHGPAERFGTGDKRPQRPMITHTWSRSKRGDDARRQVRNSCTLPRRLSPERFANGCGYLVADCPSIPLLGVT
jgi:hypothetical protein